MMRKTLGLIAIIGFIGCSGSESTVSDQGLAEDSAQPDQTPSPSDAVATDTSTATDDTGSVVNTDTGPPTPLDTGVLVDAGTQVDPGMSVEEDAPSTTEPETVATGCLSNNDCLDDQYCDLVGACQDKKAVGDECTASDQCIDEFCVDEQCSDNAPTVDCSPAQPCPEGQFCLLGFNPEDAECQNKKSEGEACSSSDECVSELCETGECATPPCSGDDDCPSFQHCDDGTCKNKILPGFGCSSNEDCSSGSCIGGNCVLVLGSPCLNDDSCDDDEYCAAGFSTGPIASGNCSPKKSLGASCGESVQCISENCQGGTCTSDCCSPDDCLGQLKGCNPDTCNCTTLTTPADTYYETTGSVDFDDHISIPVADPVFELLVCNQHFPPGSQARQEVEEAVYYYDNIRGSKIDMTIVGMDHMSKEELFQTGLSGVIDDLFNGQKAYLEVVDNAEEGVHKCHPDGATACGNYTNSEGQFVDGWTINACKIEKNIWQTKTVRFVISVNPYCYGNDDGVMIPEDGEYPKASGLAHELGHGFGMNHTNTWPNANKMLISTMQGNLEPLSAHDARLVTHYYPKDNEPSDWVNLAASSIARKYTSSGGYKKKTFSENPSQLYLDVSEQRWYDCDDSGQSPEFFAAWFNKGNTNTDNKLVQSSKPYLHTFSIQDGNDHRVIKTIKGRKLFRYSQDQWFGSVEIHADWLSGLPLNESLKMVFTVDAKDNVNEASESDNEWSRNITLRAQMGDCQ